MADQLGPHRPGDWGPPDPPEHEPPRRETWAAARRRLRLCPHGWRLPVPGLSAAQPCAACASGGLTR